MPATSIESYLQTPLAGWLMDAQPKKVGTALTELSVLELHNPPNNIWFLFCSQHFGKKKTFFLIWK